MPYARDDIDKLRHGADLVELVGAVTKVKRSGRSYMAICPFHQEKSPSMSLDPARGLYHCFGCQKGGDVFTFLEETQGLDFNEAVEELARRTGIHIQSDPGADRRRGRRNALTEVVRRAIEVYHDRLKEGADAGPARAYLRSRDYDGTVVDDYRIGYAPEGWDTLVKDLRAGGADEAAIVDAGLARRGRGGGIYDYFRGRVMFPIHDLRGDPVGFGGRILAGEGAKYLNSPDSPLYNKSRLLYGLDRARSAIARSGRSVVVEGYTDVIALHRAGVPEAVATCGTALTEEHFDLLRRFADRVVLAFDADEAGAEAARRTSELDAPVRLDLDMRVAVMPDGGDPADVVQAGRIDEVLAAVAQARPLLQFRLERDVARFDLSEPDGRARALRAAAQVVARLPADVASGDYERSISRLVGVSLEDVASAVSAAGGGRIRRRAVTGQAVSDKRRLESALLRLMITNSVGVEVISPELFSDPELRAAADLVAGSRGPIGSPVDIAALDAPALVRSMLTALVVDPSPLADPELTVRARLEAEIEEVERQIWRADPASEEYSNAWRRLIALQEQRKKGPRV